MLASATYGQDALSEPGLQGDEGMVLGPRQSLVLQ